MKKNRLIPVNIILMLCILVFVSLYARHQSQADFDAKVVSFQNMTTAMEQVTENYLEGEQRICDVWAHYISSHDMTLEEAVRFIRASHVSVHAAAHVLYTDDGSMEGLSTRPRTGSDDDFGVSYQNLDLFPDLAQIGAVGESVHITRAYTSPVSGIQSIGFYNKLALVDPDTGLPREGIVVRVVPISELRSKWVFPQEEYQNAEFSMIDAAGNYIIKGESFKNSSFLEFYKSYNAADAGTLDRLAGSIRKESGSFFMNNSRGESCLVAHTPVRASEDWSLLSYILVKDIQPASVDWRLIGVVFAGLLTILLLDAAYMRSFNKRLQQAAEEADAANRAKTDFLSTMSHDIRTPMNAITGLTVIAEKNADDPEAVRENLRKIGLAGNHLLTLINDILDISKVESGKLTLSPVTFSIAETAENLVNLSQPMVKEKQIDFNFRINRIKTEYLYADQLRLNQIFINLLSNAVKYTGPKGRVCVDLREEESSVPGCIRLVYQVSDTGIGMTKEFMETMYQPFSRQTDSRVNKVQGTGLGLAITKQMVDLMGGTIDCESEEGKGTAFTVTLDIPAAEKQLDEMDLNGANILIADDDDVLLETAKDALLQLGAAVETAESGETAYEKTMQRHREGRPFDVIILDWRMPGSDGVDTIRRIRSEVGADIPILLISAYDWSDIEETAKEAGANGFVSKPLFRSKLYEAIRSALGTPGISVELEEDNSDLAGLRALIAEDNDINWEIIHALLAMYGIDSVRAENGQICVDMFREAGEGAYDLIFMDIQMPVMNGLEAARTIRGLQDVPQAASIPIIAMTANAFSEDIAECKKAGMNSHIAKPIDIKFVIKELRKVREGSYQ